MENPEVQPVLTNYERAKFFERLEWFIEATDGYEGTLSEVWENAQSLGPPLSDEDAVAQSEILIPGHEHQINKLTASISNADLDSVVVEAAHVYLYEDLERPDLRESILTQCNHATVLTRKLSEVGIKTSQILFVDDYNPNPANGDYDQTADVESLVELVNSAGYFPETILYEGDLAPMAKKVIEFMHDQQGAIKMPSSFKPGMTLEDLVGHTEEGDNVDLKRRNIQLYRPHEDMVSCSMLDAALTILKLKHLGQGVINVLQGGPKGRQGFSYGNQQEKMRQILYEHLEVRKLPVFNLFTGCSPTEEIAAGSHSHFRKPRIAIA